MGETGPVTTVELPSAFRVADAEAIDAQKKHFVLQLLELAAIVAGSITFGLNWTTDDYRPSSLLGALFLLIAIGLRVGGRVVGLETRWHNLRSTAERAKAEAWQFAVGGGIYTLDDEGAARAEIGQRLGTLAEQAAGAGATALASVDPASQITGWMDQLRAKPFEQRRQAYLTGRLKDQAGWYRDKAEANTTAARQWNAVVVTAEAVGVLLAIGLGFRLFDVNWAGFVGAGAAAAVAWQQAKQFSFLGSSYSLAADMTGRFVTRAGDGALTEAGWPALVAEAEAALAQEQGLWTRVTA